MGPLHKQIEKYEERLQRIKEREQAKVAQARKKAGHPMVDRQIAVTDGTVAMAASQATIFAIGCADLVLVPIQPSSAGGSVIGLSSEDNLPSFDITAAGFSELLARSNDLLVPLNEAGLMAGSQAECNNWLRRTAYVLAQSGGTTPDMIRTLETMN
jgi:TPP-dependent trihydroxycyclohexane-1,2-dione (THcHDO) dehydratase